MNFNIQYLFIYLYAHYYYLYLTCKLQITPSVVHSLSVSLFMLPELCHVTSHPQTDKILIAYWAYADIMQF